MPMGAFRTVLLATVAASAPGATLTSGFPVRTTVVSGGGIRLNTGIEASCPHGGSACRGRARVSAPSGLTLGTRALSLRSGLTTRIGLRLNARGVAALRGHASIRARISVTLTGPNGHPVGVVRITTIRAP